jgi:hypothetical protein
VAIKDFNFVNKQQLSLTDDRLFWASDSVSKSFVSKREAAGSAVARQDGATTKRMILKWNKFLRCSPPCHINETWPDENRAVNPTTLSTLWQQMLSFTWCG